MNKLKINPKETGYDWAIFPQFYFLSAKILCKKIQDNLEFIGKPGFKKIFFNSKISTEYKFPGHPNSYLIFPIIFNLKHGIEIYIKTLSNLDHDKYLTEHDYKKLFNYLIDNAKNKKNKSIFEKLKKDIWPIISKYYFGTFIQENIEWDGDIQNQAERYPHRENCYKIPSNFHWITEDLIRTILDDINSLQYNFRDAWIKIARNDHYPCTAVKFAVKFAEKFKRIRN
ncbi:MAG: hypothetical protein ABID64_04395 [Nitrospirota bacterium]